MNCPFSFREGDERALAEEFLQMRREGGLRMKADLLRNPEFLDEKRVWAVHYADGGAQGEAGAVEILYETGGAPSFLYGNYLSDSPDRLDLSAVIRKLPMLGPLDTRFGFRSGRPPYPFGGSLDIPPGWGYLYMGALNHFYARDELCGRTGGFVRALMERGRGNEVFCAVAWFCGAPGIFPAGDEPRKSLFSRTQQPIDPRTGVLR